MICSRTLPRLIFKAVSQPMRVKQGNIKATAAADGNVTVVRVSDGAVLFATQPLRTNQTDNSSSFYIICLGRKPWRQ